MEGDHASLTLQLAGRKLAAVPYFDVRTRDLKAAGALRLVQA